MASIHCGEKNFFKTIDDCYAFFRSKNFNVRYVYDRQKRRYMGPKKFGVDILFYEQPWEFNRIQRPAAASKFSLTCYVPYGVHLVEYSGSYTEKFHRRLWRMFLENGRLIDDFRRLTGQPVTNCTVTGYPKLDAYLDENPSQNQRRKPLIVYAPHHSFMDQKSNIKKPLLLFLGHKI